MICLKQKISCVRAKNKREGDKSKEQYRQTLFVHVTPTGMYTNRGERMKYQLVIKVKMLSHSEAEFSAPADNSLRLITTQTLRVNRGLSVDSCAISHSDLHVSNSYC